MKTTFPALRPAALGLTAVAALAACLSACGKDDEGSTSQASADADRITRDLEKLSAPCKEEEESLGRVIRRDNIDIAQFCLNRRWGNPWVPASSFTCRGIGFSPVLTDDKKGVSCRNAQGVVSLQTQWGPTGRGLELCNPSEANKWFVGRDREGIAIALRCSDAGVFDASEVKTKFACNDPDKAFKTTILADGAGVACMSRNGDRIVYSMWTQNSDYFLTNSNCPEEGKWVLFKDADGVIKAAQCNATELPAPGLFINLNSDVSKKTCPPGQQPVLAGEGTSVNCQ